MSSYKADNVNANLHPDHEDHSDDLHRYVTDDAPRVPKQQHSMSSQAPLNAAGGALITVQPLRKNE